MALAARLPKLGRPPAGRTPSRGSLGASAATAACSAVSTQPMPMPASDEGGPARGSRAGRRRTGVGGGEAARRRPRDSGPAPSRSARPAGGDAGDRGGERCRRCRGRSRSWSRVLAVAGGEQLGGAQDQQGRGDVADLERGDARHAVGRVARSAPGGLWIRSGLAVAAFGSRRVADGVDDRGGGQQAGDDESRRSPSGCRPGRPGPGRAAGRRWRRGCPSSARSRRPGRSRRRARRRPAGRCGPAPAGRGPPRRRRAGRRPARPRWRRRSGRTRTAVAV